MLEKISLQCSHQFKLAKGVRSKEKVHNFLRGQQTSLRQASENSHQEKINTPSPVHRTQQNIQLPKPDQQKAAQNLHSLPLKKQKNKRKKEHITKRIPIPRLEVTTGAVGGETTPRSNEMQHDVRSSNQVQTLTSLVQTELHRNQQRRRKNHERPKSQK